MMTIEQAKIIVAYADNDMSLCKTAKEFYYSICAIDNRLKKIAIETGIDPKTFHGLVKLYRRAKRLLHQEQKERRD